MNSLVELHAQDTRVQGESSCRDAQVNPRDPDVDEFGAGGVGGSGFRSEQPTFGTGLVCGSSEGGVAQGE